MSDNDWLEPWSGVSGERARSLESELRRELGKSHVLWGRPAEAMACRQDCDDVLFVLVDTFEVAIVHLSWAAESDPAWPSTVVLPSLAAFVSTVMPADNAEWNA